MEVELSSHYPVKVPLFSVPRSPPTVRKKEFLSPPLFFNSKQANALEQKSSPESRPCKLCPEEFHTGPRLSLQCHHTFHHTCVTAYLQNRIDKMRFYLKDPLRHARPLAPCCAICKERFQLKQKDPNILKMMQTISKLEKAMRKVASQTANLHKQILDEVTDLVRRHLFRSEAFLDLARDHATGKTDKIDYRLGLSLNITHLTPSVTPHPTLLPLIESKDSPRETDPLTSAAR